MNINLVKPCTNCDGCGRTYDFPEYSGLSCEKCNGTGEVPTDTGQEILDFIAKYYKPETK